MFAQPLCCNECCPASKSRGRNFYCMLGPVSGVLSNHESATVHPVLMFIECNGMVCTHSASGFPLTMTKLRKWQRHGVPKSIVGVLRCPEIHPALWRPFRSLLGLTQVSLHPKNNYLVFRKELNTLSNPKQQKQAYLSSKN